MTRRATAWRCALRWVTRPAVGRSGEQGFSYRYDADGNLVSRTYPDVTLVSAGFDRDGRLVALAVNRPAFRRHVDLARIPRMHILCATVLMCSHGDEEHHRACP